MPNSSSSSADSPSKTGTPIFDHFRMAAESCLRRTEVLAALLALLGCFYLWTYLSYPALPGNSSSPLGWFGWYDQSCYLKEARAIAAGTLDRSTYIYPVGYPLLGAAFVSALPNHAFFFVNLICVCAAAVLIFKLARQTLGSVGAVLFLAGFILTHSTLLKVSVVEPWNTVPTFALFWGVIYLCLTGHSPTSSIAMSLLAALAYLVRPADAASMAPMLVWSVLRLPTWRQRFITAGVGMSLIALSWTGLALINERFFHTTMSAYDADRALTGFGSYSILAKLHLLFVDFAPPFWERSPAILFRYPWMILVFPAIFHGIARWKGGAIAALCSIGFFLLVYINYNDLWPYNIFKTSLIHYWCWLFPLLALWTVEAACSGNFRGAMLVGWSLSGALAVYSLGVGLELAPADGQKGSLRVALVTGASRDQIDFADADGKMRNGPDYGIAEYGDAGIRVVLATHEQGVVRTLPPGMLGPVQTLHFRLKPGLNRLMWPLSEIPGVVSLRLLPVKDWRDVTGPNEKPDGHADATFLVSAPEWMLRAAADWDLEASPGYNRWLSRKNGWGTWILRVARPTVGVRRLEVPDVGQIEAAHEMHLMVYDSEHRLLFERYLRQ